jgi:hypothetical protein
MVKVVMRDGQLIDWPTSLDSKAIKELAKWRAWIEAKLAVPAGTLTALQWNDGGELEVVIDRKDLAPL